MIPNEINFMNQINKYKKEETWSHKDPNQKKEALAQLKTLVLENMKNIESCVNSASDRQALSELAEVIKTEFPDNSEAEQIANDINQHVNYYFFCHTDPVKHILSYLPPSKSDIEKSIYRPQSGLRKVEQVSKLLHTNATEVKKDTK